MTALNPFEIKEAVQKHGGLAVMAILTTQTCGEPCWHAREEVCRCSCGGRNHGCLTHGGARPERTSKINGYAYRLKAIGRYQDIVKDACELNRLAGWRAVDKPRFVESDGGWWHQYRYTWSTTDHGAPARLKTASTSQRKWAELSGWKDEPCVYLLWERIDKPQPPENKVVDRATGIPLENQLPDRCHA